MPEANQPEARSHACVSVPVGVTSRTQYNRAQLLWFAPFGRSSGPIQVP